MFKRLISLLVAAILLVFAFSACGGSSPGGEKAAEKSPATQSTAGQAAASAQKPEFINLMTPWAFPQEILDQFKAKTGIEVKQDFVPNSTTDYLQARNARMASGMDLDIIGADNTDPANFAKKGITLELTNEPWMKNFTTEALDLMSRYSATPGKQYGAVYEAMAFGVWYNKDMFKKYNLQVPTNYEEFIDVCETLKKNGIAPLVQGGKDVWPFDQELSYLFLESAYQKNPRFWIDMYTGKIKFTDPDIVEIAKKMEIMYPSKGYYAPGALSTAYDQAWQMLLQKKAVMWMMGSWAVEVMTKSNVQPDFEVGVFCPPANRKGEEQFSSIIMSRHFSVLANSKKIDAAKEFLGFLTEPDVAKLFVDKGMTISTVKGVVSDTMVAASDWAKIFSTPAGGQVNMVSTDEDGKLYVQGPELVKVKNMLEAKIVDGSMTIEEYLEELQKAVDTDISNSN
jgi:raffinose/stachyose/melibiose transport system substrate-binding protein